MPNTVSTSFEASSFLIITAFVLQGISTPQLQHRNHSNKMELIFVTCLRLTKCSFTLTQGVLWKPSCSVYQSYQKRNGIHVSKDRWNFPCPFTLVAFFRFPAIDPFSTSDWPQWDSTASQETRVSTHITYKFFTRENACKYMLQINHLVSVMGFKLTTSPTRVFSHKHYQDLGNGHIYLPKIIARVLHVSHKI